MGIHFLYKVLRERAGNYLMIVPERWFLLHQEQKFYRKILSYVRKYGELPKPGKEPEGFEDHPLEYYRDELKRRYMRELLVRLKTLEIPENPEKTIHWLYSELVNVIGEGNTDKVVLPENLSYFLVEQLEKMRIHRAIGYGVKTGYVGLDMIFGGFMHGKVYTFVARMKMGKTFYLLNMARKIARESHVLFVSMEMTIEEIARRLIALELKAPHILSVNRIPSSFIDKQVVELNLNLSLMNGAFLQSLDEFFASLTAYNPVVIFIDGAYLLPYSGSVRSEWERAKRIIEELNRFALKKNVPIVCSWQLSRGALKVKNPDDIGPEHIAFTDAVAQTSSVVCAILNSKNLNMKKFHILVNRDGFSGVSLDVFWDFENMNFEESGSIYVDSDVEDMLNRVQEGDNDE